MLVRVIRSVRFQSGVSIRSLNQSRLPCVTTQIQHFAAKAAQQEHPQDLEKFSLKEFNISNAMVNHLESINIHSLFPVQAATLETALSGRDVIGKSKTGSGKTLAFVLPIVEKITEQGFSGKLPRALILAPTRELAIQVHSELRKVAPVVRSVCLYGGASYEPQIRSLIGGVDVVVGTPGRVMDHIKTGYLNTSNICIWVLDEADRMLETGFWEQVKMIGDSLPEKRQNMLWSATFPSSVVELCNQFSNDAAYFDLVGDENKIPESIKHYAIPVSANGRYFLLPDIIKGLINGDVIPGMHKPNRILVFCETKRDAEALSSFHDIPYAQSLHGGMSQVRMILFRFYLFICTCRVLHKHESQRDLYI